MKKKGGKINLTNGNKRVCWVGIAQSPETLYIREKKKTNRIFVYILKCNDKGSHIHTPDISVIIPVHIETY